MAKKVELPEAALLAAGIPRRYLAYSLRHLKKYEQWKRQYRDCCCYTANFSKALSSGMGLCLFGPSTEFRKYAFYGVMKAVVAQGHSVCVAEIEDLVQAYSTKSDLWQSAMNADLLCLSELDVPDTVVNPYCKAVAYRVVQKRATQGKPVLCCTSLELQHPDHSVDLLYSGVGTILRDSTALVSFSLDNTTEWLRKGHKLKVSALLPKQLARKDD